MEPNSRIILVGKSGCGKTFFKDKLRINGFKPDISYTSRPKRKGEIAGVDYYFIPELDFKMAIKNDLFFEYTKFNDHYYGTGKKEWNESTVFIMDPAGIAKLDYEDRKKSMIIYLEPGIFKRFRRILRRKLGIKKTIKRLFFDHEVFKDFLLYDIKI